MLFPQPWFLKRVRQTYWQNPSQLYYPYYDLSDIINPQIPKQSVSIQCEMTCKNISEVEVQTDSTQSSLINSDTQTENSFNEICTQTSLDDEVSNNQNKNITCIEKDIPTYFPSLFSSFRRDQFVLSTIFPASSLLTSTRDFLFPTGDKMLRKFIKFNCLHHVIVIKNLYGRIYPNKNLNKYPVDYCT